MLRRRWSGTTPAAGTAPARARGRRRGPRRRRCRGADAGAARRLRTSTPAARPACSARRLDLGQRCPSTAAASDGELTGRTTPSRRDEQPGAGGCRTVAASPSSAGAHRQQAAIDQGGQGGDDGELAAPVRATSSVTPRRPSTRRQQRPLVAVDRRVVGGNGRHREHGVAATGSTVDTAARVEPATSLASTDVVDRQGDAQVVGVGLVDDEGEVALGPAQQVEDRVHRLLGRRARAAARSSTARRRAAPWPGRPRRRRRRARRRCDSASSLDRAGADQPAGRAAGAPWSALAPVTAACGEEHDAVGRHRGAGAARPSSS